MATKTSTSTRKGRAVNVIWDDLASGDTGEWVPLWEFQDRTVQLTATWGGASVTWQGTLDEGETKTPFALHDTLNNLLTFTANGLAVVLENALYIRPVATGGNGTTSISAKLLGLQ